MLRFWHFTALVLLLAAVGCNKDPVGAAVENKSVDPPVVIAIHPATTPAGVGFNVQPNGDAALGVDCKNADAQTTIVFASKPLATLKGKDGCFLTTIVPKEMYSTPGSYPVYIRNSAGESNRLDFVVKPAR